MSAIYLWILILFYSCDLPRAQQPYCAKIDFNRSVVRGFSECNGQFLPMFRVKKYVDATWLQPFRPTSKYFLSNDVEGLSCAESNARFSLNATSEIDAAIYLDYQYEGAFIEMKVIDTDTKETVEQWKHDSSIKWFMFRKKISVNVRNAQVIDLNSWKQFDDLIQSNHYIFLSFFHGRFNFVPIQMQTVIWPSNSFIF